MKKLVLATTSIPRREAFDELQIPYKAVGSEVDEYFEGRPKNPEELVLLLSGLKAESVAKKRPDSIVIGFDSVVYFNGKILEKPKSRKEAFKRLQNFSGNSYEFYTGIKLIDGKWEESTISLTRVNVRYLDNSEIKKYLDQDLNYKRYALGFDPLNTYGMTFINRIEGSYNNILRGIPLEKIVEMVKRRGFKIK